MDFLTARLKESQGSANHRALLHAICRPKNQPSQIVGLAVENVRLSTRDHHMLCTNLLLALEVPFWELLPDVQPIAFSSQPML